MFIISHVNFKVIGKSESVPAGDQVFPFLEIYCSLLLQKKVNCFTPVLSIRISLRCFYLLFFYFEIFSTLILRLPFAVKVTLNLLLNSLPAYFIFITWLQDKSWKTDLQRLSAWNGDVVHTVHVIWVFSWKSRTCQGVAYHKTTSYKIRL